MRSFLLSALSFLAFGVFCSAAPMPVPGSLPVAVHAAARDVSTPAGPAALQTPLNNVVVGIVPLRTQVANLQQGDVTVDDVTPILDALEDLLQTAVTDLQNVVAVTGLDVQAIVQLVVDVLNGVFGLLQAVLDLVDDDVLPLITPLLNSIVALVVALLGLVLTLVGSLVAEVVAGVVALVQGLIPVILNLSAGEILSLLGIQVQV